MRVVNDQITLVVVLAGGRVARGVAGGERKAFLQQHIRKEGTLGAVDTVGLHIDEFHALVGEAEGIVGHLQFHPFRHGLHQEVDARLGRVDGGGHAAEREVGHLDFFRADLYAADGVRKALVGRELPHVERRQQAVNLRLRKGVALRVKPVEFLVLVQLGVHEVAEQGAVHRERGFLGFERKEGEAPRQLPYNQNGYREV